MDRATVFETDRQTERQTDGRHEP